MQEYSFIPKLRMTPARFWKAARERAKEQNADPILAYLNQMLELARQRSVPLRREAMVAAGKQVKLFAGVERWFERQTAYGKRRGMRVEHYIVSSGLREMIEGSAVGGRFKAIYASGFMYDADGVAIWPALALNYTGKTQYLFRINKGSAVVYDDQIINRYRSKADRPVPFENMVYIGDGETDVPCMRLVKDQGGHSIAVFHRGKKKSLRTAMRLVREGRVSFVAPGDYRRGSPIDRQVKAIIDRLAAEAALDRLDKHA
jgi:hypothetical protein